MIRLDPPLPVRIPHGDAHAFFVTDRGKGHHLEWTCAVDKTGEFYTVPNPQVRRQSSLTDGWDCSPFKLVDYEYWPWVKEERIDA